MNHHHLKFLINSIFISILLLSPFILVGQKYPTSEQMSWLEGTWQRTDLEKQDRQTYETWTMEEIGLSGLGVTLKGADTVFTERLSIIIKEKDLYYVATVSHNDGPVHFKLTEFSRKSMTFENPAHDFPKSISYEKIGTSKLKATISDGKQSVEFHFTKLKKR